MEIEIYDKLSVLAHPKRLNLFQLLMRRYPDAVPAGEIAEVLALKPNTTSTYLNALKAAGLIAQTRTSTLLHDPVYLSSVRGVFDGLLASPFESMDSTALSSELKRIGDIQ
ncbi:MULTISPECIES: helix-turn-helix transcriptional regulator [unclassified Ruegeria]|uniref:ArsR/SmtB family transcription factor n=1 Tax=unclassified Ruegeria TaxID=2625375 RepID=UPI001488DA3E|nr:MULTISPECIES: helix-turn-helix domain-containing protein [unclassified Ruegeria]